MFDIAIIGGGAAGLSAAVNAAARGKSTVVSGGAGIGSSSLYKAEKVNNYIGMPDMSGKSMIEAFYGHAVSAGAVIMPGRALQIMRMDGYFAIQVEQDIIEALAVIIAVGITRKNRIKGEAEFTGKGVSYCATCDGMLYKGRRVAVVGENEHSLDELNFLSEICGSVMYFPLKNARPQPEQKFNGNVTVISENIKEIIGGDTVEGVIAGGSGEPDKALGCDGVFIIRDALPAENLIFGLAVENGSIIADAEARTNIDGVFACGDCTGAPYQVEKAAGQGLIAGLNAAAYVDKIKR